MSIKLNKRNAAPVAAPVAAPADIEAGLFIQACEAFGLAQGQSRDQAERSNTAFLPILTEHVKTCAPKAAGQALEDFKRDTRSHIIAPYMTARGFTTDFSAIRSIFDSGDKKGAAKPSVVGAVGAYLSKANDPDTIAAWDRAFALGDGLARVRLTDAFNALSLDIKTGQKKVETATTSAANAGQGKAKPSGAGDGGVSPEVAAQVVKSAPVSDLVEAVTLLPPSTAVSGIISAARKMSDKAMSIADRHFIEAILLAASKRQDELDTPATPCRAA